MELPLAQINDLSRSLTAFDPISTLVVVVEMSKAKWLIQAWFTFDRGPIAGSPRIVAKRKTKDG
jgi:hypothetical protein